MRLILSLAVLALSATSALAGPVTLKAEPADDDGRVTLGDLFDGAGGAASVVVGVRSGPSAVFEAGQVQAAAARAGLSWSNPQGLRRIVVRQGASEASASAQNAVATAGRPGATVEVLTYVRSLAAGDVVQPEDVAWTQVQSHMAPAGGPQDAEVVIGLSARRALRAGAVVATRDLTAPQVIARNDMVQVAFVAGGVTLTVTGRATRDAARGEAVPVLNTTSGRTIDAVATGPGRAIAGPAALQARSNSQFASR
ncbi:flagellar biosynthesis protein FlgA [Brevundimonas sp. Leaf363]|uniref:flagellar basal body P-ring formation chaperone FlgA n=1 Tax=Brevundimonas sp. Leaf363 TaxID=1736353 RepID=UPI0006F74ACA|nr:flagellar basal body P-ring formation chaperone FlgA [Brevundimonas sp. Leaf363]KQS54429.1 flagellar biosynthesis protein FlgA [Brevundimonas sp. Leaf363]